MEQNKRSRKNIVWYRKRIKTLLYNVNMNFSVRLRVRIVRRPMEKKVEVPEVVDLYQIHASIELENEIV